VNIKVRTRTRTVKVKHLLDHRDDGFELWRTRSDTRLPAGTDVWEEVASQLSIELDAQEIAKLSIPDEVIRALCDSMGHVRCIEAEKTRTFFVGTPAQIELAEIVIGGKAFHSIAFESHDLSSARSLRAELGGTALGTPENYISFCSRILSRR
jgi:hypothetical protein